MIGFNLTKGGGYYNACRVPYGSVPNTGYGFQYAKSGVAMLGLGYWNNNGNNYFAVKLIDSLIINKNYYVEFYAISTKEYYKLACNNVALLFTKAAIYADTVNNIKIIPANPQVVGYGNPIIKDTTRWTKISGIYKAQGGEQYITLGNFKYANQTNYVVNNSAGSYFGAVYFIDDVSVIPLDSICLKADAGRDTAINAGDSVFIGSYTNGLDTVRWLNGSTVIDSTRPGFWVKPTVTTTYILHQIVNGCYSSDTVMVNVTIVPLTITNYELRITNVGGGSPPLEGLGVVNKWQTMNEVNVSHYNVQRSTNGKDFITVGKVKANNKVLNEYRYTDDRLPLTVDGQLYYRIVGVDNDGKMTYSEVRTVDRRPLTVDGISVYPNPATNQITVSWTNIATIQVYDLIGKKLIETNTMGINNINVNISQLPKGIYIVKAQNNKSDIATQKLIVQ